MKRFWKLCCLALVLSAAANAGAATIDEVGTKLLSEPKVQADLGISPAQRAKVNGRRMKTVFRLMYMLVLSRSLGEQGSSGNEGESITLNWDSSVDGLRLEDLTDRQRARLRQLAFQLTPADALATTEAQVALNLSADQIPQINALLDARVVPQASPELTKAMAEFQTQLQDAGKAAEAENFDAKAGLSKVDEILDKLVAATTADAELTATASAKEDEALKRKALAVLTSEQRKRLAELQGKALK